MEPFLLYILIPIIGASIGWITNKIAIAFLFHPKEEKKIGFIKIQGIFPKRQKLIAKRLSEIIVDELLTAEMIQKHIFTQKNMSAILLLIENKLSTYLDTDLKEKFPIVSLFISKGKKEKFKQEIISELNDQILKLNDNFTEKIIDFIDVKSIIEKKINELDTNEINILMQSILRNEFLFIEIMGAILGFILGIIQVLLFYVFQ